MHTSLERAVLSVTCLAQEQNVMIRGQGLIVVQCVKHCATVPPQPLGYHAYYGSNSMQDLPLPRSINTSLRLMGTSFIIWATSSNDVSPYTLIKAIQT